MTLSSANQPSSFSSPLPQSPTSSFSSSSMSTSSSLSLSPLSSSSSDTPSPAEAKRSTGKFSSAAQTTKLATKRNLYKHVPHCLKPAHLVAKRNARERTRVQAVNSAFGKLRKHVPYETKHKRLSKVKTLRLAIEYIHHLQEMLHNHDRQTTVRSSAYTGRRPFHSRPHRPSLGSDSLPGT
ncbi:achaete-scute-like protein [Elysia marginata]|uniref:Achaete-scute-like protein n=1 Tax=Elysia marginata TaxID=1093978 RepID=A0AAV4J655_9GAST|nr:achaete-scute-like protein [Elysia marginata]